MIVVLIVLLLFDVQYRSFNAAHINTPVTANKTMLNFFSAKPNSAIETNMPSKDQKTAPPKQTAIETVINTFSSPLKNGNLDFFLLPVQTAVKVITEAKNIINEKTNLIILNSMLNSS